MAHDKGLDNVAVHWPRTNRFYDPVAPAEFVDFAEVADHDLVGFGVGVLVVVAVGIGRQHRGAQQQQGEDKMAHGGLDRRKRNPEFTRACLHAFRRPPNEAHSRRAGSVPLVVSGEVRR